MLNEAAVQFVFASGRRQAIYSLAEIGDCFKPEERVFAMTAVTL